MAEWCKQEGHEYANIPGVKLRNRFIVTDDKEGPNSAFRKNLPDVSQAASGMKFKLNDIPRPRC